VAALQAKTKGVDQLAPQTAALYPIILPERMELLLSLPSGMKLTTVPINKSDITKLGVCRTFTQHVLSSQAKRAVG
jgi:CHAT domain-containing protein